MFTASIFFIYTMLYVIFYLSFLKTIHIHNLFTQLNFSNNFQLSAQALFLSWRCSYHGYCKVNLWIGIINNNLGLIFVVLHTCAKLSLIIFPKLFFKFPGKTKYSSTVDFKAVLCFPQISNSVDINVVLSVRWRKPWKNR